MKTTLSPCRKYRYLLVRDARPGLFGQGKGSVNYIMLNPSTADESANDPTIERLERRCAMGGFQLLIVTNLFAWRATNPAELKRVEDPVGPLNNGYIVDAARNSDMVVCAWGNHGTLLSRNVEVLRLLQGKGIRPYYLKISQQGQPEHPLRLSYDLQPKEWK